MNGLSEKKLGVGGSLFSLKLQGDLLGLWPLLGPLLGVTAGAAAGVAARNLTLHGYFKH